MKKEKKILTVAIPTFNRSETLEKIIIQLKDQKNQNFNILISDDHSSDDTHKMIKKYQRELPNLTYHFNKINLGYSGNVCQLYELAQTDFIWFLCDDDTVIPGSIDVILKAIKKYNPTVSIFNSTWINPLGKKQEAGVSEDKVYQDINTLNNYQSLMRITFLSIIVIKKILPIDELKSINYKNNIFFQLTLSLYLLSHKFKMVEIAKPIVHRNVGYKYGEFFKFYLVDHLKAVSIIDHKFKNELFLSWSYKHLPTALKLYLSQKVGLFKYNGLPTKETIKMIVRYYKLYSFFIFSFFLIKFIIPGIILKLGYFINLVIANGYNDGLEIYKQNINRAFKDNRKTGFTAYR